VRRKIMKNLENKVLAVIDIGAHSMRLEIAEISPDQEIKTLETLSQPIPIGRDVFTKGMIKPENFFLAGKIMKNFVKVMSEYNVSSFRAIATSAVREAINKDIFIDRIFIESGIKVESLDSSEEIRLIYLSLKKNIIKNNIKDALIAMIGTGASHICLYQDGLLKKAESFRMGTIRIYEELGQPLSKSSVMIDDIVDSLVDLLLRSFSKIPPCLIAVGATPRAMLRMTRNKINCELDILSISDFENISRIAELDSPEKIASRFAISDLDAIGLLPCCDILSNLLTVSKANSIYIPETNTREAIIEEMLREKSDEDPFTSDIISCAKFLGEKFSYDSKHAEAVAKYALEIFDEMKEIHRLGAKERLLLHIAAILHDIGQFLNNRQHHKHSYYLIKNSQIPGLSINDTELVAMIARYHRRGLPKKSQPEYMQLESFERVIIAKLASILRVADALDRSHNTKFNKLGIKIEDNRVILSPDTIAMDLAAEALALKAKSDLFSETYGMKVEFA